MAVENDNDLEPEIMAIRVINSNDFQISDRFDGVPYTFEKGGKATSIPIDAAFHIFGWHREVDPKVMKNYVMKRFGWNTPDMLKNGRADLFYDALKFQPIMYRMVPVELDDDGTPLKPVARPKPAPGKLPDFDEMFGPGEAARAAP
jgi:hypothetical protein